MEFQILNWYACDHQFDDDDEVTERYLIKLFGVTEEGKSVAVNILDFPPFFYIRYDHPSINNYNLNKLKTFVEDQISSQLKAHVLAPKAFYKKDFWGFTNNEKKIFVRFTFKSMKAWRSAAYILRSHFPLYESNIEPFLRFMHVRDIEPTGWVRIERAKAATEKQTRCDFDYDVKWLDIYPVKREKFAPFKVAAFDIECTSSHGDFPVAKKNYKKLAYEIMDYHAKSDLQHDPALRSILLEETLKAFDHEEQGAFSKLYTKYPPDRNRLRRNLQSVYDDIINILTSKVKFLNNTSKPETAIKEILDKLKFLPELEGDSIIQIATTVHRYGSTTCDEKYILTLLSCDSVEGAIVQSYETEQELLLGWRDLVNKLDIDIMTGYNIFGFDMAYLCDRAKELNIFDKFCKLSKIIEHNCTYEEKTLSSSALGDNLLKFISIPGRVSFDIMKVVQRDHKLDSYKLDHVASHFLKSNKKDVHPSDIFRLQKGSAADRAIIADYCVQDSVLCNRLVMKLEILANNIGMSNVCSVPLEFIFMRGQGIKIFSLVAKQCRLDDFMIPTLSVKPKKDNPDEEEEDDGYEGAIVLDPKEGIYIDYPVSVLDYASLYPASMISENLSHDCLVLDPKYDNLEGIEYLEIRYDLYETKDNQKTKVGERICRFVQNHEGVIPRILKQLLKQRKLTRKKIEFQTVKLVDGRELTGLYSDTDNKITDLNGTCILINPEEVESVTDTYEEFQKAVLDGLQLAYKVTANSLYGQCGAKTSQIYMKDVAACTTATGRKMILMAKEFIEKKSVDFEYEYEPDVIYGDSVTGDTPILVRYGDGHIDISTIDSLSTTWTSYDAFKPFDSTCNSKEQALLDAEVWADNGWAKIHRIIRHKTAKTLYRVQTAQGCVDVTEDHSLLDAEDQEIKPQELLIGQTELSHTDVSFAYSGVKDTTINNIEAWVMGLYFMAGEGTQIRTTNVTLVKGYLDALEMKYQEVDANTIELQETIKQVYDSHGMKKVPTAILNAPWQIRLWFLRGCIATDKPLMSRSKIGAQGLYFMLKSFGYNVIIHLDDDVYKIICDTQEEISKKVTDVRKLAKTSPEEYVYDIETSCGKFHGGVGALKLKNTDSLFAEFKFKRTDGSLIKGKEAIPLSRALGMKFSKEFKKTIKPPHDLEWEKLFYPFILLSKKRYCANKYEFDDHKYKQASMGIVLKRRDNANIVKKIYGGVINIILNEQDIPKSLSFLSRSLQDLIDGKSGLEDLIISKTLRSEYKDPTKIAHKVLADRMGERDEGTRPQVNDRIPFVYIQTKALVAKKQLQGDRIEHPDYIRERKLVPDYEFYITNQIMKPCLQLYALVLENLPRYRGKSMTEWKTYYNKLMKEYKDIKKAKDKWHDMREREVEKLLFEPVLVKLENKRNGNKSILDFFGAKI
jgi:DNA polymerase elongation subunit (family B)